MIKRLSAELNINTSAACTLLRHCKWDEEQTTRRFSSDQQKLVTEAGVATQLHRDIFPPLDSRTMKTCLICYEDVSGDQLFALPCGHHFCNSCWSDYLRNQIEGGDVSGRNALNTRCADPKCREVLGMEACELILSGDGQDEQLLAKYRKMLLNSFVDDSDGFTWCPRADCERVVAHSKRRSTVSCVCGSLFCFGCKAEAHAPASCNEALQWLARDKGSSNLDMKWSAEQPHTRRFDLLSRSHGPISSSTTRLSISLFLCVPPVQDFGAEQSLPEVRYPYPQRRRLHAHRVHTVPEPLVLAVRQERPSRVRLTSLHTTSANLSKQKRSGHGLPC